MAMGSRSKIPFSKGCHSHNRFGSQSSRYAASLVRFINTINLLVLVRKTGTVHRAQECRELLNYNQGIVPGRVAKEIKHVARLAVQLLGGRRLRRSLY